MDSRAARSIDLLPEMVEALPAASRRTFRRLYHVSRSTGRLIVPDSLREWVIRSFGSAEAAESQIVVRVTNMVTMEGAALNPLRASRPVEAISGDLRRIIESSRGDQFCRPEEQTPRDSFGRVRGLHSVTASNIAKYAPFHGLVIFDEHDPLRISEAAVRDYLDVGRRWAEEVMKLDPEARYYFFGWNALWSSGASIIHGHAQVSCIRDMHYAKIEGLRRAAADYRRRHRRGYFDDLEAIHDELGLALRHQEVAVLAHLTPARDKEVVLIAHDEAGLAGAIYRTLDCLISTLGTRSFNVALYQPPLAPSPEDWSGFPVVARVVDRGDPMRRTADVGSMEMYACPVVPTDPFPLAEALRERFGQAATSTSP